MSAINTRRTHFVNALCTLHYKHTCMVSLSVSLFRCLSWWRCVAYIFSTWVHCGDACVLCRRVIVCVHKSQLNDDGDDDDDDNNTTNDTRQRCPLQCGGWRDCAGHATNNVFVNATQRARTSAEMYANFARTHLQPTRITHVQMYIYIIPPDICIFYCTRQHSKASSIVLCAHILFVGFLLQCAIYIGPIGLSICPQSTRTLVLGIMECVFLLFVLLSLGF